ncbi:acetoacetate--CoA ligase [uncultured Thiothrix sp.]|uniref:acetoacetate--CoA ligase n=1 Tax=uncultured Thiothrix sp. TaxID=223185 RepID=UPI0026233259|nr:acetoacetate--CoA ligase [uncultured Thiothrix sp.]
MEPITPLWSPSPERMDAALIDDFIQFAQDRSGHNLKTYQELYQWSIDNSEMFWSAVWDFSNIIGEKGLRILVDGHDIERAQWFPDAQLNFAENLLREPATGKDTIVIEFKAEDQIRSSLSYEQLYNQVSRVANWLKEQGVVKGDRVAGYLPNMPETIIAMLAATSLGAIWTSTSPDFGEDSVIERFGQTTPKVLFATDGYFYNGKRIDIRAKVEAVKQALPSLIQTVVIPLLGTTTDLPGLAWANVLETQPSEEINFVRCGFNDPLYVLYSSGTTGKPKCITHKIGGVLLQHLKEHQLQSDVRPGDKVFYFTTCGWMMWNWLASGLASQATLVLYDGSPFYPNGNVLWDYAQEVGVTLFGTSAKYLEALSKAGLEPLKTHDLSTVRTLCSTGSVLAPESFDYVYRSIKQDVCLSSISGGTDIVSCFVLGCPILPVYRGETQCRGLGMAVDVFNDEGKPVVGEKGELVCTKTFPSQPAFFWGDEDGQKYHDAYFARFPNVWHHGDYVELTEQGGVIIFGRSDATLNPGGVRIGTAEIYRHVEQLEEVLESIAIGQDWDNDVRVVLFVVLREGYSLDEALKKKIRDTIRTKCTPRHVPAKIIQVAAIPRTKSGKIVELAVREVVHNRPVKNTHALANPEALELYRSLAELQV